MAKMSEYKASVWTTCPQCDIALVSYELPLYLNAGDVHRIKFFCGPCQEHYFKDFVVTDDEDRLMEVERL